MPEVPIHKNGEPSATKRQIGPADEIFAAYAKAKAETPKRLAQETLGLSVAGTNGGHVARDSFGGSACHRTNASKALSLVLRDCRNSLSRQLRSHVAINN
jgi:hypothetical protein